MNQPGRAPAQSPAMFVESSHDLPLVSLSVATQAGALLDPTGMEGLSRLSARLMRRTGGGSDPQELDVRIDSLGASLGVEVGASTVLLHGTVIRRSLRPFLELVAEVLARPGLAEAELGRLVRETQAELTESLDDDRGLVHRWFRRKLFAGHPYGRPVSGTNQTLARIKQTDVAERAKTIAAASGLVFAWAGDIDAQEATALSEQLRSALPQAPPFVDTTPEPAPLPGRRLVLVDKPERTQTQILIGGLGTHPRDADHTALLVGNTIFGGTFTARLTQEVRSKRGWSYGAYSSLPIDRRRQAFSMWTFPKADDAAACIRLELDMLRALHAEGVTKKELAWAKRYLVRSHAFAVDTAAKRVGLALDTWLLDLPPSYYEEYLARISAVTLDEVNAALHQRLSVDNLLIAVVGTAADLQSAVEGSISDLVQSDVVPYDSE